MVYGIWYVVYGMKMAFTVYLHMFHMHHTQAAYNVVHLFLVTEDYLSPCYVVLTLKATISTAVYNLLDVAEFVTHSRN